MPNPQHPPQHPTQAPQPRQPVSQQQRKQFPRPLPLHLTHAMSFSPSWPAVLNSCMSAWSPWNPSSKNSAPENNAPHPFAAAFDPQRFMHSFASVALDDATQWLAGVSAYHDAPETPLPPAPPVIATYGAAQLLDYQGPANSAAPLVLVVPSLINKAHILDLLPDRSFLRGLAKTHNVWLLDWGTPGADEQTYSVDDYLAKVLLPALNDAARAAQSAGRKVVVMGYCMGGLLAMAAAALRPDQVDKLVLLATPWDFTGYPLSTRFGLMQWTNALLPWLASGQMLTVDHIQTLFTLLQPFAVYDKYKKVATAGCDTLFAAVEDWLNDGVPLPPKVAYTCLHDWFQMNTTANGQWRVLDQPVLPQNISCPTLVVVPAKDQVVPAAVASPLGSALPNVTVHNVPYGHIGMIVSQRAEAEVLPAVASWLGS